MCVCGGGGGGGRGLHLTLHCNHHNDFCIKLRSYEARFHVSSIARAKSQDGVHRPQLLNGKKEVKQGIEPTSSAYQPNALPLHKRVFHDLQATHVTGSSS